MAVERFPCGFCHQEAAQAHGQEEAPQAAEEDARPASQARQVRPSGSSAYGQCGRVVLVTGVSRDLGRRFARAAAADPAVARVIGVDVVPPRGDIGDVSFVRADIRNPVIAKVIAKEDVDTVVHMSVISTPGSAGGRNTMKELNVIGTMQLLAACQKAPGLRALVVKSTTTVYGASSRDPAMFTEDMEPRRAPRSGYAKDVAEIEGYVRGFARRRPDVRVTLLRAANVIGPRCHQPDHLLLPAAGHPDGARPRRAAAVPPRDGPARRAAARHAHRRRRHVQRRRRRHADALPGGTPPPASDGRGCRRSRSATSARCSARRGSPTSPRSRSRS